MPRLRDLQQRFGALGFGEAEPADLAALVLDDRPVPAAERLAIYRNNTRLGLVDPLAATFPVVRQLVGEAFFGRMAGDFILAHPPTRPELLTYGHDFPAFISDYPAAASVPYLADMARLELAWHVAYNAADREPMPPSRLSSFAPEQLEGLRLVPHPSLRFVASSFPLMAIWQAHQSEDGPDGPIDLQAGPETLLVYRPHAAPLIRRVGAGSFDFVMALAIGQPLAAACTSALAGDPDFNIADELARLLAAELFVEAIAS